MHRYSFPRPVGSFVGRRAELARVFSFIDKEVVFLVYGPGGIGKTEFVYQAIEELSARPPWTRVPRVVLPIEERGAYLLALLRQQLGLDAGPTPDSERAALNEVVRALNARPAILLLDDLHEVDPVTSAGVVAYLSRRVRHSRIFITSRLALPLGDDPTLAVVIHLGPLGEGETAAMVQVLTRQMGISAPDNDDVYRRSGGSPFLIQRALVQGDKGPGELTSSLDRSLRALSPAARRQLLLVALAPGRGEMWEPPDRAALEQLSHRFLIHQAGGHLRVHDFVRAALLRSAHAAEIDAARREVAARLLREPLSGADGALRAVDAVQQLCAAGDWDAAWALIRQAHRLISAVGLEPALQGPLERLRQELPGAEFAVTLQLARVHLRAGRVALSRGLLKTQALHPEAAGATAYQRLLGQVAQREGDHAAAEAHYQAAQALSQDPREAGLIALSRADLRSAAGRGAEARALLAALPAELPEPAEGRRLWSLAFSYLAEDQPARAAALLGAARRPPGGDAGPGALCDTALPLRLLEIVAQIESDQVDAARLVAERELERAAAASGWRAELMVLAAAVVRAAAGELRPALPVLEQGLPALSRHADPGVAVLLGHYLIEVQLAVGELDGAARTLQRVQPIAAGGAAWPGAFLMVQQARLLLMQGRPEEARVVAERSLQEPRLPWRARLLCLGGAAWAALVQMDVAGAQRYAQAAPPLDADAPEGSGCEEAEALLLLLRGDGAAACQRATRAAQRLRAGGRSWRRDGVIAVLGLCTRALGDVAARARAEQALRLMGEPGAPAEDERGARLGWLSMKLPERGGLGVALGQALAAVTAGGVAARFQVLDRGEARVVDALELARLRATRALFVDLPAQLLAARGAEVRGKLQQCMILAQLAQAAGTVTSAERLYQEVWRGGAYHPLRHRGTVYVAVNRLRRVLRELAPHQEVVQTAEGGWQLSRGAEVVVVVGPAGVPAETPAPREGSCWSDQSEVTDRDRETP